MSVEAQQILAVSSFCGIVAATTFPSIGVRPRTPSRRSRQIPNQPKVRTIAPSTAARGVRSWLGALL
jgi:hypothetical protein